MPILWHSPLPSRFKLPSFWMDREENKKVFMSTYLLENGGGRTSSEWHGLAKVLG